MDERIVLGNYQSDGNRGVCDVCFCVWTAVVWVMSVGSGRMDGPILDLFIRWCNCIKTRLESLEHFNVVLILYSSGMLGK